jgi:predicted molibdopterin-dependent oxidoreductase YjgC
MDDWRIAVELMARLDADPDLATTAEVTDALAQAAPAFAGVTSALVSRARDGVVLPLREHRDELVLRARELSILADDGSGTSWDPIKVEGIVPADSTLAEATSAAEAATSALVPSLYVWDGAAPDAEPPGRDAYALRLVVGRQLYDHGRVVSETPVLDRLRRSGVLRVNPHDAARIGVETGGRVKITSTRGQQIVTVRPDTRVPAGLARYDFTGDGAGPAALVDAGAPVTDIRLETVR